MRNLFSIFLVCVCCKVYCFASDTTSNVRLKVTYMNEPFTRELVLRENFLPNQLVPLVIELEFIDSSKVDKGDYLTIELLQVHFVTDYDVLESTQRMKGHLVMMALQWQKDFPLKDGSRVVIVVDYNYHRNDKVLFTGQAVHEVAIATGDTSQILAERKKLGDSLGVKREAYDNDTRLIGCVLSAVPGESWEIIFNGKPLMQFKSGGADKASFNVDRLTKWSRTQQIDEFIFYKKTWLGKKRIQLRIPYSTTGKYLLIVRNPKGRKDTPFYAEWTNTDLLTTDFSSIYPYPIKK